MPAILAAGSRSRSVSGPRPPRGAGAGAADYSRPIDLGSFLKNYLRPALVAEGLDNMRFHDFRHTYASLMLAAGFPPYEVSRWLGQANLATTDSIYAHLHPTTRAAQEERLERFIADRR